MQCRDVRELLDSYLGQELLVETNHEVLRHLEGCDDCRTELEARLRVRSGVKRAFESAPLLKMRPEFAAEVAARVREMPVAGAKMPRRRSTAAWLALAASVTLAVAAGMYFHMRTAGPAQQLARQAAGDHQNCAVKFRLPEPPIPLREAAEKYDPAYARLETTPADQVTTAAGVLKAVDRHSCVFDSRRFGHVVFRIDDHLVSLLMTADPGAPAAAEGGGAEALTWLPRAESLSMASLRIPGHIVFIVSDLPDAPFRQVAQALASPASSLAALFGPLESAPRAGLPADVVEDGVVVNRHGRHQAVGDHHHRDCAALVVCLPEVF